MIRTFTAALAFCMTAPSAVSAAVSAADPAALKPATRNRAEIPAEFRWDFSAIYPSWAAWEAGMKELDASMDAFVALKGTLAQGPARAAQGLPRLRRASASSQYRLYRYPQLQRDVDTRDQAVAGAIPAHRARSSRSSQTATAWFTPELLTIPEATVTGWIAQTPTLAPYRFTILDNYRRQAHVLDDEGRAPAVARDPLQRRAAARSTRSSSTSDIKFPSMKLADGSEVVLSPANYGAAARDEPRARPSAARPPRRTSAPIGATANTYAAIYDGLLQRDWFLAQARNFPIDARRGARRQRDPDARSSRR